MILFINPYNTHKMTNTHYVSSTNKMLQKNHVLPVSCASLILIPRSNVNFCHMTNQEGMCVGVMKSTVMIKVEDHHRQDFLSTKKV